MAGGIWMFLRKKRHGGSWIEDMEARRFLRMLLSTWYNAECGGSYAVPCTRTQYPVPSTQYRPAFAAPQRPCVRPSLQIPGHQLHDVVSVHRNDQGEQKDHAGHLGVLQHLLVRWLTRHGFVQEEHHMASVKSGYR